MALQLWKDLDNLNDKCDFAILRKHFKIWPRFKLIE